MPSGETMLQPGDKAVFMGTADSMRTLERRFSGNKRDDHVMIIGGGNVGFMVAEYLRNDKRKNIRVIEQDEERCHKLAKNLPGIMVLHHLLPLLRAADHSGELNARFVVFRQKM